MTHEEFDRLAEAAFDDATADERLAELAATDPELAARWEDLQAARRALAGAGTEPLPPGLHEHVLAAVRRGRRERGDWLSFVRAAVQVRPAFALGGAVAAGFALGALALGLLMGPGARPGDHAQREGIREGGTSASLPPLAPSAGPVVLEGGGVRVVLTAWRGPGGTIVRLEASGGTPADVVLAWEPAALRLAGVRWEGPEAPGLEPGPGRVAVRVTPSAGSELSFEETVPGGDAIRVTLRTPGGDREEMLRLPR